MSMRRRAEQIGMAVGEPKPYMVADVRAIAQAQMQKWARREEYRQFVVEYLTDYNDNFEGEPCSEIVDEVLGYLEIHEGMSEHDCIQAIEGICAELFD